MLEIDALAKSYVTPQGPLRVLEDARLRVGAGERVALMGESGSGKSTLLHLVAGLDKADSGRIELDGVRVESLDDAGRARLRRSTVAVVFQAFNLVPSLSVGDNLSFQARLSGREEPAWTGRLAERLGLAPLLSRWPEQLSGGQQQRVAIGRALAARPKLVLADEPTGALDEETAESFVALARELAAETGCAFLMATHSARLAGAMDRTATLSRGRVA